MFLCFSSIGRYNSPRKWIQITWNKQSSYMAKHGQCKHFTPFCKKFVWNYLWEYGVIRKCFTLYTCLAAIWQWPSFNHENLTFQELTPNPITCASIYPQTFSESWNPILYYSWVLCYYTIHNLLKSFS